MVNVTIHTSPEEVGFYIEKMRTKKGAFFCCVKMHKLNSGKVNKKYMDVKFLYADKNELTRSGEGCRIIMARAITILWRYNHGHSSRTSINAFKA